MRLEDAEPRLEHGSSPKGLGAGRSLFDQGRLDTVYQRMRKSMGSPPRRAALLPVGIFYKNYFSERQLQALENYKHSGADHSLTYKYVLGPLYGRLIGLLPMWLAPNAVTLTGLLTVLLVHVLLLSFAPRLDTEAPRLVHFAVGIGLFFYQIMDNLDGKQARRTGSSSPLGHLFDHLCDAINVTLSGISVTGSLGLGSTRWSVLLVYLAGFLIFYTATLEEYVSGTMILREINGPNEGLLMIQGVHYATAIFGMGFWNTPVKLYLLNETTLSINQAVVFVTLPSVALTVFYNYIESWKELRRRNVPRMSVLSRTLWPSLPLVWFTLTLFSWVAVSPTVVERHCVLLLWTFGAHFFYMVSRLILAHLTDSPFPWFVPHVTPLILGFANSFVGNTYNNGVPPIPEHWLLFILLGWSMLGNARRIYCMGLQICEYLNISVFKITPLKDKKT